LLRHKATITGAAKVGPKLKKTNTQPGNRICCKLMPGVPLKVVGPQTSWPLVIAKIGHSTREKNVAFL
jgi:hypothetical protein